MGEAVGKNSARLDARMRVIHIVSAVSEEASGPSYSVVRLCESLIDDGIDVQLAALAWGSQ